MSTQTAVRTQALPRVNLLPPEIEERRKLQTLKVALGGTVLASLGLVAALFVLAAGQVSSAQNDLDQANSTNQSLTQQVASYSEVPQTKAKVAGAQAQLAAAMGQEVRWSYFLNDLGLRVPANVWLTKLTITQTVDGTTSAASSNGTTLFSPELGTIEADGNALAHTDVAAWLDSLARERGLNQVYFSKSDLGSIGDTPVVSFSSKANITPNALSQRYTVKAGS
jgi:Tfp pilus assembly protein PilN